MRISRLFASVAGLVGLMAAVLFASGGVSPSAAGTPPTVAAAMGTKVVNGIPLRVHVVVEVSPGQDGLARAEQAVARLGAKPLSRQNWGSLVDTDGADNGVGGVWWDALNGGDDTITLEYSNLNEGLSQAKGEIQTAAGSWTSVATSRLIFDWDNDNNICPSLVLECGQGQPTDNRNTIGWVEMEQGILGVAWMIDDGQGGAAQEADVAFNTRYNWTTGGSRFAINLQTVALHELGHVAGLDHSDVRRATMYASYSKADTSLHSDDIEGISTLYPSGDTPVEPSPEPTPEPTADSWCDGRDPNHPAFEKKGCVVPSP